jgi:hypothetical protein
MVDLNIGMWFLYNSLRKLKKKKLYRDDRYQRDPQPFEWFQRYETLKPFIEPHIPKTAKILQVGCGTSSL